MSRPCKAELGACITLPFPNSKGKITGGGMEMILDNNSTIGKGLMEFLLKLQHADADIYVGIYGI